MLTFLEAGTEQAADLGDGDDMYCGALERKLDAVAKLWPDLPPPARRRGKTARLSSKAGREISDGVTAITSMMSSRH
jgi:hypothetical protein